MVQVNREAVPSYQGCQVFPMVGIGAPLTERNAKVGDGSYPWGCLSDDEGGVEMVIRGSWLPRQATFREGDAEVKWERIMND